MPYLMIFQKKDTNLDFEALLDRMVADLGVPFVGLKGESRVDPGKIDHDKGSIWVDLEELAEDEGVPVADFEVTPRAKRSSELKKLIEEIVKQDDSLADDMAKNARDIVITWEDTIASSEAASALAYAIASDTESGILLPATSEEEETMWFETADDFADAVFGDDEDDDEEYEDDDEEYEDDEEAEEEEEEKK